MLKDVADTFLSFPTSDVTARFTAATPAQKRVPKTTTPTKLAPLAQQRQSIPVHISFFKTGLLKAVALQA